MRLHLAQAFSNRAPRGRKHDFKRCGAVGAPTDRNELILSFVPSGEQRIWRSMTRMKLQPTRDRVLAQACRMRNPLAPRRLLTTIESLICISSSKHSIWFCSRHGETDPKKLAQLGGERWQCTEEQLVDALTGRAQPVPGEMLGLQLQRLQLIDPQMAGLNSMIAAAMKAHRSNIMISRWKEVGKYFRINSASHVGA